MLGKGKGDFKRFHPKEVVVTPKMVEVSIIVGSSGHLIFRTKKCVCL